MCFSQLMKDHVHETVDPDNLQFNVLSLPGNKSTQSILADG